jgi:hypothetical protein
MSWDDDTFEVTLPPGAKSTVVVSSTFEDEVDLVSDKIASVSKKPAEPLQIKNKHVRIILFHPLFMRFEFEFSQV